MANRGINKVILLGNLGQDPDTRSTASGMSVCLVNLATSSSWKSRETGRKAGSHRMAPGGVLFRLAEIASEYLRKGSQVYIEGRLQTRKWQDEANGGITRYTTEIVASEMLMLGGGNDSAARYGESRPQARQQGKEAPEQPVATAELSNDKLDDDIPF